jgi:hypothetical protein
MGTDRAKFGQRISAATKLTPTEYEITPKTTHTKK